MLHGSVGFQSCCAMEVISRFIGALLLRDSTSRMISSPSFPDRSVEARAAWSNHFQDVVLGRILPEQEGVVRAEIMQGIAGILLNDDVGLAACGDETFQERLETVDAAGAAHGIVQVEAPGAFKLTTAGDLR